MMTKITDFISKKQSKPKLNYNFEYLNDFSDVYTPTKVLDIGAFLGEFTLSCKKVWPKCECLMVEANELFESDLKKVGQPYLIECLGDSERIVDFYIPKDAGDISQSGSSYYKETTDYFNNDKIFSVKKNLKTLDSIIKDQYDFIKIDTQGSELDIINGGINTIVNANHVVLEVSLIEYNEGSPHMTEIIKKMWSLGFPNMKIVHCWGWPDGGGSKYKHLEPVQFDIIFSKN